jgi:hypothetical protein
MRSRLEARYAAWLDENGIKWEYEPRCFASDAGQYLPDFLLHDIEILGEPREVYVEVKPTPHAAQELAKDGRRVWDIIWASEPDAWFLWAVPHDAPVIGVPDHLNPGNGWIRNWDWCRASPSGRPSLAPRLTPTWWDH